MKIKELKTFTDNLWNSDLKEINLAIQLEQELLISEKTNILEIQEDLEKLLPKVISYFHEKIKIHKGKFISPRYIFSSYNENLVVRYDLSISDEKLKSITASRLKWSAKIKESLTSLDWRQFEMLSKWILESNQVDNLKITQSSQDQGIDFYGIIEFNSIVPHKFRLANDIKLRLLGQSKHSISTNKVGHQKVSSFATEIRKLRKGTSNGYFTCLDDEFLKLEYPIVGLFLTNTEYSPKSINFANEYGIIIWDGSQVSEDLCNTKFISLVAKDENIDIKKLWE